MDLPRPSPHSSLRSSTKQAELTSQLKNLVRLLFSLHFLDFSPFLRFQPPPYPSFFLPSNHVAKANATQLEPVPDEARRETKRILLLSPREGSSTSGAGSRASSGGSFGERGQDHSCRLGRGESSRSAFVEVDELTSLSLSSSRMTPRTL